MASETTNTYTYQPKDRSVFSPSPDKAGKIKPKEQKLKPLVSKPFKSKK